jgi:hypothetical protein
MLSLRPRRLARSPRSRRGPFWRWWPRLAAAVPIVLLGAGGGAALGAAGASVAADVPGPPATTAAAGATAASATPPPTPTVHVIDEKERVALAQTENVRLSLPTESDVEAWASSGVRVQLGYEMGSLHGLGPALSFSSKSALLRPSIRIDRRWALGVALLYGTGPGGLRWSATFEPTFYPWRRLGISVGVGYGGLSVSDPNAPTGTLQGPTVQVSRDLTDGERLQSCTGSALTAVLRVEYLFVVGPLFATGPFAEGLEQWTRCQATFGRTDPETGQSIVLSQWWQQVALDLGWWFAWR